MKLKFLGSGSAFTLDNFQSNMLLTDDAGHNLLIDCGGDARWALKEAGKTYKDIHAVYVSHLHNDHIGGMEWLGFCTHFDPSCKKADLFISKALAAPLWSALEPGMASLQGEIADLHTYWEVCKVPKNGFFVWGSDDTQFRLVQTIHIMDGFVVVPSYALLFKAPSGKTVFITTDTQFCPNQIMDFYKMADVIFHDCEATKFKSGVHAHYDELCTLPKEVKAKMWLYHYQPNDRTADKDGFLGFVAKGQEFDL